MELKNGKLVSKEVHKLRGNQDIMGVKSGADRQNNVSNESIKKKNMAEGVKQLFTSMVDTFY